MLKYFNHLCHFAVDSYLIVLIALEDICEKNLVIGEQKLIHELHVMTIDLYNENLIKQLPSCLKELIGTALWRFNAMELAVINSYTTQNGSTISFVSCPFDRLAKIEALKQRIIELQHSKNQSL